MGLGALLGFAWVHCANFKLFWPLALAQQAPVAIVFHPLRRLGGAAVFRNPRPSAGWGFPFWPSGLTLRSSRPAKAGGLPCSLEKNMRHSTSSIADELWYRGAISLLGALLGSSAAFLVGIFLIYALHFSVELSRIAIAGAAAGAFLGAILPNFLILGIQAFFYFIFGLFGAIGNGVGIDLPENTPKWLLAITLFGAAYFFAFTIL